MQTTAQNVAAAKTQHIALAAITFDPSDNYRWGSKEAMEHDISTSVTEDDAGQKVNAYRVIVNSIRATGHVQVPIGVSPVGKKFRVIYGFNRYLAAKEIGLRTVPAVIYPEGTDEATLATLQVVENSDALKRVVNWVAETRMWERLFGLTVARYDSVLPSRRPKTSSGHPMSPQQAAWHEVSTKIGRSELTMRERIQILNCLDADVQHAAHQRNWSFNATKEFYSGDAKKLYTHDFVTAVLAEIKRSDPNFSHVTPAVVTKAKSRVTRWIAEGRGKGGAPLWRKVGNSELPEPAESEGCLRLSPAGVRDIAINIATALLKSAKITLATPETGWATIEKTASWHRVIGIGVGIGSVRLPDRAGDISTDQKFDDLALRAQHFACGVFVAAALRCEIEARCAVRWAEWYDGGTLVRSESRSNRVLFRSIAQNGANHDGTLRMRVAAAWAELDASGMMPRMRA